MFFAVLDRAHSLMRAHRRPVRNAATTAGAATWYHVSIVVAASLSVAVLIGCLTLSKIFTNDVWIHLKTGEIVWQTHRVPHLDPYSYTAADHLYVAHEWLSALVFYFAYRIAGVMGLIWLKFIVVLLTAVFLGLICVRHRDRLAVVVAAFGAMTYIATTRYLERPHLFSFLFMSIDLWLLFEYRDGGRRRGRLLAILPVQVVWANMHAGFIQGIALLGVFAAGETAAWLRARYFGLRRDAALPTRDLLLLLALPVLSAAVTLINPYGVDLLEFPFRLTGMDVFMQVVFEWFPPLDARYGHNFTFVGYWGWITVLFASFIAAGGDEELAPVWRRRIRMANFGFSFCLLIFSWAFMWQPGLLTNVPVVWIGLAVLFSAVNVHRLDFTALGIVALMVALSLRHNRSIGDAVTVTLPILTRNLTLCLDRLDRWRQRRRRQPATVRVFGSRPLAVAAAAALLFTVGVQVQLSGYRYAWSGARESGLGIADTMPVCAIDYIAKHRLSGNAYVSYNEAAMLIWSRYPAVKVNMDSRNDVYGPDLFVEYNKTSRSLEALRAFLNKYRVEFLLVGHSHFAPELTRSLLLSGEWVEVFFDHQTVVYVRNSPEFQGIIAEDAYRTIYPALMREYDVPRGQAEAYLQEATRAAAICPRAWLPRWLAARARSILKGDPVSGGTKHEVIARNTDASYAWTMLARLYTQLHDDAGAIEAYERALELNPAYQPARESLRKLRNSYELR